MECMFGKYDVSLISDLFFGFVLVCLAEGLVAGGPHRFWGCTSLVGLSNHGTFPLHEGPKCFGIRYRADYGPVEVFRHRDFITP